MASRRSGKLVLCKELHANRKSRIRCLKESIRVKEYFVVWYSDLLGVRDATGKRAKGKACDPYEKQDAKLQLQIDDLQKQRKTLRHKFENGESVIRGLQKDIGNLCDEHDLIRQEAPNLKAKINRYNKLKDKLKAMEETLADSDFDIESLIEQVNEA